MQNSQLGDLIFRLIRSGFDVRIVPDGDQPHITSHAVSVTSPDGVHRTVLVTDEELALPEGAPAAAYRNAIEDCLFEIAAFVKAG